MTTKLLIVAKSIDGGTGTFVRSLRKLSRYKIDIKVLVLERPSFRKLGKEEIDFLRKKNFYPQEYNLNLKSIGEFIEEIFWVRKKAQTFKPNVVLGIDIHANLLVQINKIFSSNLKTILTTHIDLRKTLEEKSTFATNAVLKHLVRLFYQKASVNICVSKGLAKDMQNFFKLKNVHTIYNGLDRKAKKRNSPKTFPKKKTFTFITFARLFKQKDHETLLKAFEKLLKEEPKSKLIIGSDGPLKKRLVALSKKLGVEKNVEFVGWVKDQTSYLKKAHAFVLSSKREGFGYVLTEAMNQALPVISTDTNYGPSEILENGKYGVLVPVGAATLMCKAMLKLSTDKRYYKNLSKKSLERSSFFSEGKMLKKYKKVIDKLKS
jgi:glycosyltransferase involved in cell wall biosynthesis